MSNSVLEQEIAQLISGNQIYNNYIEQWRYLLVSYLGGEDYRQAGLLQKYQLESSAEYNSRLRNTPLDNACQSVVGVYNSFLFREAPDRDFGTSAGNRELEEFLKDADMDGRSFNSFMADVVTWSSVFGHTWIIMSKPDIGALTRADEIAQGVRPYVNLLTPVNVLDWSWYRRANGRYELNYFKYIEDINGDIRTVREWTPDQITTYVADVKENNILEQTIEPNGLGRIPAVIAYNGRTMVRGIGVSDIADIADSQRLNYNLTSEIHQSAVLDSHPSLVTTPTAQIGTGAGSLIQIDENTDPGLKPYLLEFSGASIDSMLNTIKHVNETIDKMANTGGVRANSTRTMSGVALEVDFQILNARLAEKADAIELAEENIWRLWCAYQDIPYDFEIDYPGSFNIRDTANELAQLLTAKNTATNPVISEIIDEKLIELLGEDPAEYTQSMTHTVTVPGADRTAHIQEMIMSGYTDADILQIHSELTQEAIDSAKRALLNV